MRSAVRLIGLPGVLAHLVAAYTPPPHLHPRPHSNDNINAASLAVRDSENGVQCTAATVSCPACHDECIDSATGDRYRVLCDARISSGIASQVLNDVTAAECLQACDGLTGCLGIVTKPDGSCELVGGSSFEIYGEAGYTAFIAESTAPLVNQNPTSMVPDLSSLLTSVVKASPSHSSTREKRTLSPTETATSIADNAAGSAWPHSSSSYESSSSYSYAYSTSYSFSTTYSSSSSYTYPTTTTTTTTSPTAEPTCDSSAATCPDCEAYSIFDKNDQNYLIECSITPPCERTVWRGRISQEACLEACDRDTSCTAAIHDRGFCKLCDGFSGDEAEPRDARSDYVVFVLESARD